MLFYESDLEQLAIETLQGENYTFLTPEEHLALRPDLSEVILKDKLMSALTYLNPQTKPESRQQALHRITHLFSGDLVTANEAVHKLLVEGVEVERYENGQTQGEKVKLIDFDFPENNDFIVCNQFSVTNGHVTKRPDIILFINGLPLVVIELKNPADENATVQKAFTQLQNYKDAIPQLFTHNLLLVASDGLDARAGTISGDFSRFLAWKTVDGKREDSTTTPQLDTLIKGMLRPAVLLDLLKNFTVFERSKKEDPKTGITQVETIKKIAAYHQYHAVNKAVESTIRAAGLPSDPLTLAEPPSSYGLRSVDMQPEGDQKAGVVWHTQGSGKSLSMVFYAGKIVQSLQNPTIVVLTDRNDLDEQLFATFASCRQLLRQDPVQAGSRSDLKRLLQTNGGGIVFTTIQKFFPDDGAPTMDALSQRRNIVVMADEAHRSQYGFAAKTLMRGDEAMTTYGFAKHLRDALPGASFIGFTGTPVEKEDASTPAVFGNYIDIYDIEQAVKDGATVPIYYESRLVQVHLKPEEVTKLDEELLSITESEDTTMTEIAKAKWTQLESIVGHTERLKTVAKDIVQHFEQRQETFAGKGMIVAISRRVAVELYEQIIALRPDWHSPDLSDGAIKVVMTSSSSDPQNWQQHHTTKEDRRRLGDRLRDPKDPLQVVIVRDMWLTGFDAPCLHTMYVDKPMKGHNLMQAIARVNRVFKDKPGGLIVDYIGIATDLKRALATYTESGGNGSPTIDMDQAVQSLRTQYEIVEQMFHGFDFRRYFEADTRMKMTVILEAQEFVLNLDDGKNRFLRNITALSKAFVLCVPHEGAMALKDEVAFFQAVKARIIKFEPREGRSFDEIDSAIRQIVNKAVVSDGVIDIFDAAGIKKPDISILSDEFLEEIKGMERKNTALELLKRLLNDEVKGRARTNVIQSRKFSEMLENAIKRYQSNLLTTAQLLEELIAMAKDMRTEDARAKELGLSDDEIAFYDALIDNGSAREVMKDDQLRELARMLVDKVRAEANIDWTIFENARARLRVAVKRLLNKYGYPPDKQAMAADKIIEQAEALAKEGIL